MTKRKKEPVPKILKAWWSEKYAQLGDKVTLNALTQDAAYQTINFQVYEFRRKSKILREIAIPAHGSEVKAKWRIENKTATAEYGNPEFRFKAKIGSESKTSKTLYVPATLEIALTFDDGPAFKENPKTEKVLRILKGKKIKAVFFVEHSRIISDYGQSILRLMVKGGHEVGLHGVDPVEHHLKHQDTPHFKIKLKEMRELIKKAISFYPKYIRPPGGWGGDWEKGTVLSKSQLRKIYRDLNMIRVNGWEAEIGHSEFWKNIDRKIETASKGDAQKLIILSHDLRDYDIDNLSSTIEGILKRAEEVRVRVKFVRGSEILK